MTTFGSVCSGIEAASVAWQPLGWKAAWLAEIEPFPSAVLAHRFPDTKNLGDMNDIPELLRSGSIPAPDVLTGGTPCQAFSVAGLRRGLKDSRGQLTLTFVEIANEIDNRRAVDGLQPCTVIWENVPGVLNTADNAFGCFLGALAGEDVPLEPPGGKWANAGCVSGPQRAIAWRVLDAQYFGVAQRRRRVFVVASAADGFSPWEVLFEQDGMRRDTAPSRGAGKETAACAGASAEVSSEPVTMATGQAGAEIAVNRAPTLTCNHEAPIVMLGNFELYDFHADPVAPTLSAQGARDTLSYCLPGNWVGRTPENGGNQVQPGVEVSHCLTATDKYAGATAPNYSVRRLTPVECERLQGFPDGWTAIPWRGKPADLCPDSLRYKALGNSWAVPVARWVGAQVARRLNKD